MAIVPNEIGTLKDSHQGTSTMKRKLETGDEQDDEAQMAKKSIVRGNLSEISAPAIHSTAASSEAGSNITSMIFKNCTSI